MRLARKIGFVIIMTLSPISHSETQIVARGLAIELPEHLDLTYQIIPEYDEREYVLAGWNGEDLLYFMTFEKLPSGWLEADRWFAGLMRDLRAASGGKPVDVLDRGSYPSAGAYSIHYMEYRFNLDGGPETQHQIASFLGDSGNSYVVSSTLVDAAAAGQMHAETVDILKTARAPTANVTPLKRHDEDNYIGTWTAETGAGHGDILVTLIELKKDLSFTMQRHLNDEPVIAYSGAWSSSDGSIHLTYLYRDPDTPAYELPEPDRVLAFDGESMVLVAGDAGADRIFRRIPDR